MTLSNSFFFPYSWCVDPSLIKEHFSLILISEALFHLSARDTRPQQRSISWTPAGLACKQFPCRCLQERKVWELLNHFYVDHDASSYQNKSRNDFSAPFGTLYKCKPGNLSVEYVPCKLNLLVWGSISKPCLLVLFSMLPGCGTWERVAPSSLSSSFLSSCSLSWPFWSFPGLVGAVILLLNPFFLQTYKKEMTIFTSTDCLEDKTKECFGEHFGR